MKDQLTYKCKKCDFKIEDLNQFVDHVTNEHENIEKEIPCHLCNFSAKTLPAFNTHIKGVHNKRYKCDFCDSLFGISANLKGHLETRKKSNSKILHTCEECNFKSCTKRGLINHIKGVHEVQNSENVDENIDQNESIQEDVKPDQDKLEKSSNPVNPNKIFKCNVCEFTNDKQKLFIQHFKMKHRGQEIPCNNCEMTFKMVNDFNKHYMQ